MPSATSASVTVVTASHHKNSKQKKSPKRNSSSGLGLNHRSYNGIRAKLGRQEDKKHSLSSYLRSCNCLFRIKRVALPSSMARTRSPTGNLFMSISCPLDTNMISNKKASNSGTTKNIRHTWTENTPRPKKI